MDAHGQPFMNPALVTNMSTSGLVIQGVRRKIRTGEILDVQMGKEKAQFRVVWVGSQSTSELGLQRIRHTRSSLTRFSPIARNRQRLANAIGSDFDH